MTGVIRYPLRFQIGARTLFAVQRTLVRVAFDLPMLLADIHVDLPPTPGDAAGFVLTSWPETRIAGLQGAFVRQRYTRYHADFGDGFEAYLAHFSARTRNAINRKRKRFPADAVRCYRTPDEVATFIDLARPVSRASYQHRLLDAGLPDTPAARAEMLALAAADKVRAFLLFRDGQAIAYLYLPVKDDVLIYAYLGHDPQFADLSPGTVLQIEAIRILAEEGRYTRLDFTEGEGQHKRMFATGGIACADVLLLRPTLANRAVLGALRMFDGAVARGKALSHHPAFGWLKALRR